MTDLSEQDQIIVERCMSALDNSDLELLLLTCDLDDVVLVVLQELKPGDRFGELTINRSADAGGPTDWEALYRSEQNYRQQANDLALKQCDTISALQYKLSESRRREKLSRQQIADMAAEMSTLKAHLKKVATDYCGAVGHDPDKCTHLEPFLSIEFK